MPTIGTNNGEATIGGKQAANGLAWLINNVATVLTVISLIVGGSIAYDQIGTLRAHDEDHESRMRKQESMNSRLDVMESKLDTIVKMLDRPRP